MRDAINTLEHALYATSNRLGGGDLVWTADWVRLTTPGALTDYRNAVYRSVLGEDEADSRIDATIEYFAALRVPFRWWVTPSTRPRDMAARLEARGFTEREVVVAMTADPAGFPPPCRGDVAVELVGPERAEDWLLCMTSGWAMPQPAVDRFRIELARTVRETPRRSFHFLASWRGEPAGTGMFTLLDGFAHFSGSVVHERFRRRGIYRELIHARMEALRGMGVSLVTNHCVRDTSAPVCRALGFRPVCEFRSFLYRQPA